MDTDIAGRIEVAVRERCAHGEMFTAYDITRQLRAEGLYLYHDDCRTIVHTLYCQGGMDIVYERTLVDLGGDGGPAQIYHRYDEDPRSYLEQLRRDVA